MLDVLPLELRKAGWRPERLHDAFVSSDAEQWALHRADEHVRLVIQRATDARPETIRGRFAVALLEAVRLSQRAPLQPSPIGAVVSAPRITSADLRRIRELARLYGDGVGWGALGDSGHIELHVPPLHLVRHPAKHSRRIRAARRTEIGNPFSDLGQWIIKILLKRTAALSGELITGPADRHATYAAFAEAARVSVKTVWQVTTALERLGFMAPAADAQPLIRVPELLERWRGALQTRPQPLPCRWLIPAGDGQLHGVLRDTASVKPHDGGTSIRWRDDAQRACLAGIAACRSLGLSITPEVVPEVYVASIDILESLGLVHAEAAERPDVLVHVARWPESVFRAAVVRAGVPTADIIQTWLDTVDRPTRGQAQARRLEQEIFRSARHT